MPSVTLTAFVDFVAASGTTRITKARNAKAFYEQGYAPERDFYKSVAGEDRHLFRRGLERGHAQGFAEGRDRSKEGR
jgi:hypothetical protein